MLHWYFLLYGLYLVFFARIAINIPHIIPFSIQFRSIHLPYLFNFPFANFKPFSTAVTALQKFVSVKPIKIGKTHIKKTPPNKVLLIPGQFQFAFLYSRYNLIFAARKSFYRQRSLSLFFLLYFSFFFLFLGSDDDERKMCCCRQTQSKAKNLLFKTFPLFIQLEWE